MTTTDTIAPYRSAQPPGRDGFGHLLLAEWTKFRTVRGWVIGMVGAAALAALATVALAGSAQNSNGSDFVIGPGGRAVTDSFYFVHQTLTGNGSMAVRVASLSGGVAGPPVAGPSNAVQPWAKAGIMIKASTKPGSAYAAMLVTGAHGVRMQYDFTHDIAGLHGSVSAASPRWLRLTRSGDTITGYDSADGTHWIRVGTATLAGLRPTVQIGLFATSPGQLVAKQTLANDSASTLPTWAIGTFDHVSLLGGGSASQWTGSAVDEGPIVRKVGIHCGSGPCLGARKVATHPGFKRSGSTFTVTGTYGDIAPYVPTVDPLEVAFKGVLIGLVAMIAIGVLFVTSEYRRGLIRTTLAASPRRGRVLLAKAIVVGAVTFVAGAVAAAIAFPIAESKLRSNGWPASVYPVNSLVSGTGLQVVLGTAALLAIGAIFALAAGSVLRRSAGAITTGIVLLVFPLILATFLPMTSAQWLLRLTPAAAFGVQTTTTRYPQVISSCMPYHGCYPLTPWAGMAVLGAWAAIAMAVAVYLLRRRDA